MPTRDDSDPLDGNRYRALLGLSTAIASGSDLQAVLHSISSFLTRVVPFDSISLLLVNQDTAQLYALDAGVQEPGLEIGMEVPFKNTAVASALERDCPVFVPDTREELKKIPEFAHRIRFEEIQSSYIFPVSSSGRKLGALIFGTPGHQQYSHADVELMASVTAHVSVALESALALDSANRYRLQLERERDRLKLLLEINNHIVTHLDVNELLRAASISIRGFFKNAFTGFWLFEEGTNQLQCITMDFPDSRGYIETLPSPEVTEDDLKAMRTRVPSVLDAAAIALLPAFIRQPIQSESIVSIASVPLVGSTRPLGVISLGSQQQDALRQPDLDLLVQVGNQISLALENALAFGRLNFSRNRLQEERLYLESEIQSQYNFQDIIGSSPALRNVLQQVATVAPTDSTVLLIGETGTGKELIARAIHNLSARRERTFVRLNCAALPPGLMESELFGYEKGAFTGALAQKRGRIELAHEGSLFLDEIGDIELALQPKLLRVLQEKELERLGSNRTIKVNVRLIAATHQNLPQMVHDGDFREDLYYRLNVFPIVIPPLRDRREDIPLLVHYFVSLMARKMRKSIRIIPRDTMKAMMDWPWPGNVRELENFIERSVILSKDDTLVAPITELKRRTTVKGMGRTTTLHAVERETILQALRTAHGRVSGADGAAEHLGLKRTTLQRKMQRLGISKSDYS